MSKDDFTAHASGVLLERIAALEAEVERLRNKVPARSLSDEQLHDEIVAVDAVCDHGFGEGGGSPGEWWYERADELECERKRRELEAGLRALAAREVAK